MLQTTPSATTNNGVLIDRVHKSFAVRGKPPVVAIDTVDIRIEPGEFVSIVGPSGCGKSTLLMCVAGLERPTRGRVEIGSEEVVGPQSNLGIVFQAAELLEWRSALDNVLLQIECRGEKKSNYRARAETLLRGVGLGDFLQRLPHELSGGMRQRVALCRALIHDPEILLMDEPFGALDALTRDQMNTDLQRIWMETRKTALFVTHSIDEAVFLSDRVLVFGPRPGRIVLEIRVDLPRPRRLQDRTNPEFGAYVNRILGVFSELGVLNAGEGSDD